MGKRPSTDWDSSRDKRYSAFVYVGEYKFRKSLCKKRNKKKECLKWEQEYLDLAKPQDAEFIKASMILMSEAEL